MLELCRAQQSLVPRLASWQGEPTSPPATPLLAGPPPPPVSLTGCLRGRGAGRGKGAALDLRSPLPTHLCLLKWQRLARRDCHSEGLSPPCDSEEASWEGYQAWLSLSPDLRDSFALGTMALAGGRPSVAPVQASLMPQSSNPRAAVKGPAGRMTLLKAACCRNPIGPTAVLKS